MMKMKNVLIPLCLAVLLTATACGGTAPESTTSSTASTSASVSDSASSLPESAPVAGEAKTIVGVITDGSMNTVTINTDDGKTLSFAITDEADKTGVNGMTVGDTLEITYTGEIAGDVTTDAVITKLVQTPAPTASSLPESAPAAAGVSGDVSSAAAPGVSK